MPLTPCFDTNSMLVIDRRKSVELCAEALRDSWRQDRMQEVFYKHARPVVAEPGKAFLFNQEIIHGNVPNETDQTRVSIDFRMTVRDQRAVPFFQRALEIREDALGSNHPDIAPFLNNLAVLYRSNGNDQQALELYLRALAIR